MRQTTSITLILALFFALLCFQTKALPFFGGSPLRNTITNNAHATSSGVIDLKKDVYSNGTFYVEADLSSSYSSRSSSPNNSLAITDTVKMMVSIANSETLVASSCISFDTYDCNRYNCIIYGKANPIDFPTFTADVQYGRSFIYLDYNYWGLNYASLYFAQSCDTRASPGTGSNRSGVLGLGTGSGAKSDFTRDPIFSVLIDSDLNAGKLLFWKDTSSYAKSSSLLNTFSANETWQISTDRGYIETPSVAVAFNGNIMFDINSDAIGLPYVVYTSFLNYFTKIPNISCTADTYRPSCTTTQKLEELPDLTLTINDDQIKIPSKIYATLTGDSETYKFFFFNFKATDPLMTGKSYVSPSFQNSIILDANFMSYYYTVFDATSGSNVIYLYSSGSTPSPQPNSGKWVAIGAVVAILLVSICYCTWKKRKAADNRTTATAPLNDTTYNNTIQAPLVYNNAVNSNYNGYNHPAQPQVVYQPYPQPQGTYNSGYLPPPPEGHFQERVKQ